MSGAALDLPGSVWGWLALTWGIGGVAWLLGRASYRMALVVAELDVGALTLLHLVMGAVWIGVMAYAEGYRAMQRQFAPRVVKRAFWLARANRPVLGLLAPAFCMGLVHASRRRLIVSWSILAMIVALIVGVRMLAQPWRGLVDAGVVVGLGWGIVAIVFYTVRALKGRGLPGDLDLPAENQSSGSA